MFALSAPCWARRAFEVHLCQLLARMGHPADRRRRRRALAGDPAHARPRGDAVLQAVGRDREDLHLAATAISTSCAWSWSGSTARAAAGRRRATSAQHYRERCRRDDARDRRARRDARPEAMHQPVLLRSRPRTMSAVATRKLAARQRSTRRAVPDSAGRDPARPQGGAAADRRRRSGSSSSACRSARATRAIVPGELVHVHNVESDYLANDVDHYEELRTMAAGADQRLAARRTAARASATTCWSPIWSSAPTTSPAPSPRRSRTDGVQLIGFSGLLPERLRPGHDGRALHPPECRRRAAGLAGLRGVRPLRAWCATIRALGPAGRGRW